MFWRRGYSLEELKKTLVDANLVSMVLLSYHALTMADLQIEPKEIDKKESLFTELRFLCDLLQKINSLIDIDPEETNFLTT